MKTKLPSIQKKHPPQLPPIRVTDDQKKQFYEGRKRLKKTMKRIILEAVLEYYLPMMYGRMEGEKK